MCESQAQLGGDGKFTGLHLRAERDWIEHCKVWAGDNCLTNTYDLPRVFVAEGVRRDRAVYVATDGHAQQMTAPARKMWSALRERYDLVVQGTLSLAIDWPRSSGGV